MSVVIVGVIRRKPVLTHASIVCEGMLASVNSVNSVKFSSIKVQYRTAIDVSPEFHADLQRNVNSLYPLQNSHSSHRHFAPIWPGAPTF